MSSTENVETPFSFKATAHLHATEYALSLLRIILSVWAGPETSCLPQEHKQRRYPAGRQVIAKQAVMMSELQPQQRAGLNSPRLLFLPRQPVLPPNTTPRQPSSRRMSARA